MHDFMMLGGSLMLGALMLGVLIWWIAWSDQKDCERIERYRQSHPEDEESV
jgi:hypothetical protein